MNYTLQTALESASVCKLKLMKQLEAFVLGDLMQRDYEQERMLMSIQMWMWCDGHPSFSEYKVVRRGGRWMLKHLYDWHEITWQEFMQSLKEDEK